MSFKKHLFPLTDARPGLWVPLPVVGSFYPAYRQNIGSSMDIGNAHYEEFNRGIKNIFRDHPGLVYVSGHEYLQQLIYTAHSYKLNSGSLAPSSFAGPMKAAIYSKTSKILLRF